LARIIKAILNIIRAGIKELKLLILILIKNIFSNWAKVEHSVPQRSILGPSLFLLYINYLPKVIDSKATTVLDFKLSPWHVLNVVCFLLGNSLASEFYMLMFRNTLFISSSEAGKYEEFLHTYLPMKMEQSVVKRQHIKFRCRGITRKNAYNTTVPFADATGTLITSPNTTKLQNDINVVFKQISIWFEANLLSKNLNKSHFIQFTNKSTSTTDICIKYYGKHISNTINTKFLGLFINHTMSWKTHIKYIIPKLSSTSIV